MKRYSKFTSAFFLLLFAFVFRVAYALEAQYPSLPQFGILTQNTNTLPQIFLFLFTIALWLAGIVLFVNVALVGFQYMTSGANPDKRKIALRRFGGVVFGAAMLFGVFIILNTINPELTGLRNLTFGICNGPGLPACPQVTGPTITSNGGTTGTGTTGGSTLPPPVPMPGAGGSIVNPGAYYCQGASNWQTIGSSNALLAGSLGQDGCAPDALAIILEGFGDTADRPDVVATYLTSIGAEIFSNGLLGYTNWDFIARNDVRSHFGLEVIPVKIDPDGGIDVADANTWLSKGYWILGQSETFPCTGQCKHNFVITGVSASGYDVKDPQGCAYNQQETGSPNQHTTMSRGSFKFLYGNGWYGAYAVRKL